MDLKEGEDYKVLNPTPNRPGPGIMAKKENFPCPSHESFSEDWGKRSGERSTNIRIDEYCTYLSKFLRKKNDDYGDSLQNPSGIFQKNKMDGILARLDDKLGRIKSVGINDKTEDTIEDLIGYLIHLKIMMNGK